MEDLPSQPIEDLSSFVEGSGGQTVLVGPAGVRRECFGLQPYGGGEESASLLGPVVGALGVVTNTSGVVGDVDEHGEDLALLPVTGVVGNLAPSLQFVLRLGQARQSKAICRCSWQCAP